MDKLILLISLIFTFSTFGQNGIEELKKSSDKGKTLRSAIDKKHSNKAKSKTLFVNPFVGTGGHGHTYPGASAPFGMMQLSPDTRYDGWDGCSGYHYDDSVIYGFSHTHLSGTGVSDYADLLITPQVGKAKLYGAFEKVGGFGHSFDHASEKAQPGFYSVFLKEAKIRAELTVDVHSGLHKYTFAPGKGKKYILLDLDYRDELIAADVKTIGVNTVQGHRISKAWAEEQHFYFHLESNINWKKAKYIKSQGRHKLLLRFPDDTKEIILRVGMSSVDVAGAKTNLNAEIDGFDFSAQRAKINRTWEQELSKIYFHADDEEINKTFYTALYHAYLNPNTFSDVDGRYRGTDQKIHQLSQPQDKQYTVFSLWDTFRANHPLFTITQQAKTLQFINTFLRIDEQQNDLPVWELAGNETECMIGYHSVSVIADAFLKGIIDFDAPKALRAMVRTSTDSAFAKNYYSKNGFISLDREPESLSKILEYAYDDFCISQMAKKMNADEIANLYQERSLNFINHFDPSTRFFRARRGGLWMNPFHPEEVNFNFTEANAWQYSLFAPHAIPYLIDLHGGKAGLEEHLDNMFSANSKTSGREQADITGLIGQYAHGNEPSHHMAYLYNYVDRPDKTQLYVDSILNNLYSNTPDGLSGNEDCGQMSAWYVLSALGFYQVSPGIPIYDLGRPLLNEAQIQLENGKTIEIEAKNQSKKNKFVQQVEWNGKALKQPFISHDELMIGGKLVFTMSDQPSEIQPVTVQNNLTYFEFTPVPFFTAENRIFDTTQLIELQLPISGDKNFEIEYKIENTSWEKYSRPFTIENTTHIQGRTYNRTSKDYSAPVSVDFVRKNDDLSIQLLTPYTLPYASSGNNALIDGIKGDNEFRTGDWQGFYGFDVKTELTFDTPKSNFSLEIGMLEDLKSWIFFPTSWTVETSEDGVTFKKYKTQQIVLTSNNYRRAGTHRARMEVKTDQEVKAVRITVKNAGACPDWHLGKGLPSWLFLDEITVQ